MTKLFSLVMLLNSIMIAPSTYAASADDNFYRGKNIRIIVGFAAGGGFMPTRAIARHMGRIFATHRYRRQHDRCRRPVSAILQPPDGLLIGSFIGSSSCSKSWETKASSSTTANSSGSVRRCKTTRLRATKASGVGSLDGGSPKKP
jgi:hypothetical protein